MAKLVTLFVSEDGALEFVYDDEVAAALRGIGPQPVVFRASHVEPTRDGRWSVDVAPILQSTTPVIIGTYPSRAAALEAETEWVIRHLAGGRAL